MEYPQVLDTIGSYWPQGLGGPHCLLNISLREAYTGAQRVVERNGERVRLAIPPGVHTGDRIYLPRSGREDAQGVHFCTVMVADQPPFKRFGADLHLDWSIDIRTFIHGDTVLVPTLSGQARLEVPAWTAPGTTLRLTGKGMPILNHPDMYGDLCIHLQATMPANATPLERQLIADAVRLSGWRLERQ